MQYDTIQRRSLMERIFRVVHFEGTATAILAPTTAWLTQRSVLKVGGLTIPLVITAMIWSIICNILFDRLWPLHLVKRAAKVWALHALGFKSGFIVIGVSIVARVLNISLIQIFTLEIGFFLFFPPYTTFCNWAYDMSHERVMKHRQQRITAW